ncbi:MAG: GIY-YIG nuclease family protein [Candidatus Omnitrophota bacterium]
MWQVYILECKDGSLYTGITSDIKRRYKEHERGGARYTSYNPPVKLLYTENCADRSGALKREYQIKSLPRSKKLELIFSDKGKSGKVFRRIIRKKMI